MNPEDLLNWPKEKLVVELEKLNVQRDENMASMVMIREEILTRLDEEKKDGELVGEYQLRKSKRITFRTTLEQAEELGAVKSAPDTKKLRKLHDRGADVPGVQETIYLSVRRLSQEEASKND